MGVLLFSDRRVLELRRARTEVTMLDRQISEKRDENDRLKAAIESANRHELPAETVAREELHLVMPDDVVLLYPEGSLDEAEGDAGAGHGARAGRSPRSLSRADALATRASAEPRQLRRVTPSS